MQRARPVSVLRLDAELLAALRVAHLKLTGLELWIEPFNDEACATKNPGHEKFVPRRVELLARPQPVQHAVRDAGTAGIQAQHVVGEKHQLVHCAVRLDPEQFSAPMIGGYVS